MVKNLRILRDAAGLTRKDLAKQLGLSERKIYTYEKEDLEPDLETIAQMADFFGVTTDYLIGREGQYSPSQLAVPLELKKLGGRLQAYREEKKISRKEVADKAGITATYLSMIEKGAKIPKLDTCLRILNALEMSADAAFMDSLIAGQEEKASYLRYKMASLDPQKRFYALRAIDAIVHSLEE